MVLLVGLSWLLSLVGVIDSQTQLTTIKLFKAQKTWNDAVQFCSGKSMNLLEVRTKAKADALDWINTNTLVWHNKFQDSWIGLHDPDSSTRLGYSWAEGCTPHNQDGTSWSDWYSNNEPLNYNSNKCVKIVRQASGFAWRSESCNQKKMVFCESVGGGCTFHQQDPASSLAATVAQSGVSNLDACKFKCTIYQGALGECWGVTFTTSCVFHVGSSPIPLTSSSSSSTFYAKKCFVGDYDGTDDQNSPDTRSDPGTECIAGQALTTTTTTTISTTTTPTTTSTPTTTPTTTSTTTTTPTTTSTTTTTPTTTSTTTTTPTTTSTTTTTPTTTSATTAPTTTTIPTTLTSVTTTPATVTSATASGTSTTPTTTVAPTAAAGTTTAPPTTATPSTATSTSLTTTTPAPASASTATAATNSVITTAVTNSAAPSTASTGASSVSQTAATTTTANVNSSLVDAWSLLGYDICSCNCNSTDNKTLEEKIEEIVLFLTVDKSKTSKSIRKKISAPDNRPSAQNIGFLGIALLIATWGLFLVADSTYIFQLFKFICGKKR